MKNTPLSQHLYRWGLILLCVVIAGFCYSYMNEFYDPLARYKYATDENRGIILDYLDSSDIDYIINQHLRPEIFLPFIEAPGFAIHNAVLYKTAQDTQKADTDFIVNFVNRYRGYFSAAQLKELLKNYSYDDLINFYETQTVLYDGIRLVEDPSAPLVILGPDDSVYKYVPDKLADYHGIQVREEMLTDLDDMLGAYALTMDKEQTMELKNGYLSYEDLLNDYADRFEIFGDDAELLGGSGGRNEEQLGYTVVFAGNQDWLNLLEEHPEWLNEDHYDELEEELSADRRRELTWLENKAWRYGFVIRYPKGKESVTGQLWQPFKLRYVGRENARELHLRQSTLEQAKLSTLN